MIHDVKIHPLKVFTSNEGSLLHLLRSDSPLFKKFGEVYISTIMNRSIKAWKLHLKMEQNLVVAQGKVRFVFYDPRKESPSYGQIQEIILSRQNYSLLQIPAKIWYGFQGESNGESLLVNCATIPHSSEEIERLPAQTELIPYRWIS